LIQLAETTTLMNIARNAGATTRRAALFVPSLVALGLVAGLIPCGTVRAGNRGRTHARKVVKHKHAGPSGPGQAPTVPAPAPPTTTGSTPTSTSTSTPISTTTSTPIVATGTVATVVTAVDVQPAPITPPIEMQLVALTNQVRQANGLPALAVDDRLTLSAQVQANAMATLGVMAHELPGAAEPTLQSRMQFVGYDYVWVGEILGEGALDAPTMIDLWMNSPPHREDILSPEPVGIGVAVAYDPLGYPYYCEVFGVSRSTAPSPLRDGTPLEGTHGVVIHADRAK
jgi:uncharacterized protein YkwD